MADPLDRALIPKNRPQGERQATVQAMRQAGLPQGTSPQRGISFDPLQQMQPTQTFAESLTPRPDPMIAVRRLLDSPNPIVRDVARRLLEG